MFEPRFAPGDQVLLRGGPGHVWRVVDVERRPVDAEPAYSLRDSKQRHRMATESVLTPLTEPNRAGR